MRWGWTPPKSSTFRRTSTTMARRSRWSRLFRMKSAAPFWPVTRTAAASACAKKSAPCTACRPDAVLVGNGTADLIWLLAHAYGYQRQAAILSPTFSEYADGVIMAGGHPSYFAFPGWQRINDAGRRTPWHGGCRRLRQPFRSRRHDAGAYPAGLGVRRPLARLHLQSQQPHRRVSVTGRAALPVGGRARCPLGRR